MLTAGIFVTLVMSPLLIYSNTGGSMDIISGLRNPGDTYIESRLRSQQGMGINSLTLYAGQTRILLGFLILLVLPAGALFWNRISGLMKAGVVAAGVAHILESTGAGRNKGFADILLVLPWLMFLQKANRIKALSAPRGMLIVSVAALAALFGFWAYFNRNIGQRSNGPGDITFYDKNGNIIISLHPFPNDSMNAFLNPMISYCTQGYYGLACSLELPFEWTYGVGNSPIWTIYADKYWAGTDSIAAKTYARRVEAKYGWDSYVCWHTVYPWVAGDFTFPGTLVIVFILGMVLAMTWRDSIERQNYLAATLFIWIMVGLSYFSANDQLMQMEECVLGLWVALFLWWATRSAMRHRSSPRIRQYE